MRGIGEFDTAVDVGWLNAVTSTTYGDARPETSTICSISQAPSNALETVSRTMPPDRYVLSEPNPTRLTQSQVGPSSGPPERLKNWLG